MKRIPMLDLGAQHAPIRAALDEAVARVMASQTFVLGPEVKALEQEIAAYARVKHAVGVSSGTDALLATLMALGVGAGDEVITTPFTFVATCEAIARLGARAVFVDIAPPTFLLDVERVERAITRKTKAIVPVHLFGQMADTETLAEIGASRGIAVVADAAQAIGAELDGEHAGARGTAATYSFYPSKNLGALGDAGMVVTNDEALAARIRLLRNHGQDPKYASVELGGNFRMDALQAAVLRAKLPHLDGWSSARRRNAARYRRMFAEQGLEGDVVLPAELPGRHHVFHQFVIRTRPSDRDALRAHLAERGIESEVYYPVPMHLQRCFAAWGYRERDFPNAERACAETLALPVYPELTEAMQAEIVEAIAAFHR